MAAESRLKEKNITLPTPNTPVANYVGASAPATSSSSPARPLRTDGKPAVRGKVGRELSVEQGYQVAREVGLNLLRRHAPRSGVSTRSSAGEGPRMVNSADGFGDQPKVINGFSDLMVEVFGEAIGKHAAPPSAWPNCRWASRRDRNGAGRSSRRPPSTCTTSSKQPDHRVRRSLLFVTPTSGSRPGRPASGGGTCWQRLVFGVLAVVLMIARIQLTGDVYNRRARRSSRSSAASKAGRPACWPRSCPRRTACGWVARRARGSPRRRRCGADRRRRARVGTPAWRLGPRHAFAVAGLVFAWTFTTFVLVGPYARERFGRVWFPVLVAHVVGVGFTARLPVRRPGSGRLGAERARFRAILDEASTPSASSTPTRFRDHRHQCP